MSGYIIKVKTEKLKVIRGLVSDSHKLIVTDTLVDNIVYHNMGDAINRIRSIVKNKCDKHQYKVLYDNLDRHKYRMHSEMDIAISRKNWEVYKIYTLKQIKIN